MSANIQQNVRVCVAWASSQSTALDSCAWTDETSSVRLVDGIDIRRGRSDEQSAFQPGTATFTLDNPSGRFSPGNTSSPLSPNVTLGKPVRISVRQAAGFLHNFLSENAASFETSVSDWGTLSATIARSLVRAWTGTYSALVTWTSAGVVGTSCSPLVIGRRYVASAYVWVPAGSSPVEIGVSSVSGGGSALSSTPRSTNTTGAWQRIAVTFVASRTSHDVNLYNTTTASPGTAFIDGVQVTESADVLTFSTAAASGLYTDLFTGYITDLDEMPGFLNTVQVSASDRLADMSRIAFDTSFVEQLRANDAVAVYPLDGSPGATVFGDASGLARPSLSRTGRGSPTAASEIRTGVSDNPTWTTQWVVGADTWTSTYFLREASNRGYYLASSGAYPTTAGGLTVEAMVNVAATDPNVGLIVGFSDGTSVFYLRPAFGNLYLYRYTISTASDVVLGSSTTAIADDAWHSVAMVFEPPSGGSVRWRLYRDGTSVATGTYTASATPTISTLYVGGSPNQDMFNGYVANVGVHSRALSGFELSNRSEHLTGFNGDLTTTRFLRVVGFADVESTTTGTSTRTMSPQPWVERTPAELLADIATTENGLIYAAPDGRVRMVCGGLATSTMTLPAAAVRLGTPVSLSDQYVVNEASISLVNGGSYTARDQVSVDRYGRRSLSMTTYVTGGRRGRSRKEESYSADLATAASVADYIVASRKDPAPSVGSLTVDLTTADAAITGGAEALAVDLVGYAVGVAGLPRGSGTFSLMGLVQGVADRITATSWERTLNLTPSSITTLLGEAVFWIDADLSGVSSGAAVNLGTGGSALNATLGSGTGADASDPLKLAYAGTPYVYLPNAVSNQISVPDENALDLTGDLDLRVRVSLDSFTTGNQGLCSKPSIWNWYVSTTGLMTFQYSTNGSTFTTRNTTTSLSTAGLSVDTTYWLRMTFDADNGSGQHAVAFYWADDSATEPTSWTQIGTTITNTGTVTMATNTQSVFLARGSAGSQTFGGRFYRGIVRDGIGGTTVLDADASVITSGSATLFTAATGQSVTIGRSTSGRKCVAVVAPVWLLGTDDRFEVSDNALIDFTDTDSFTVLAFTRVFGTVTANMRLVDKSDANAQNGWALLFTATPAGSAVMNAGTYLASPASPTITTGASTLVGMVRDGTAGTLAASRNATLGTASTVARPSVVNALTMRIGADRSGLNPLAGELMGVAVFRRALTTAELTAITDYYRSRYL